MTDIHDGEGDHDHNNDHDQDLHARPSRHQSFFAAQRASLSSTRSRSRTANSRRSSSRSPEIQRTDDYDSPPGWANLSEVGGPSPIENPRELRLYRHFSLEDHHIQRRRSTLRNVPTAD